MLSQCLIARGRVQLSGIHRRSGQGFPVTPKETSLELFAETSVSTPRMA